MVMKDPMTNKSRGFGFLTFLDPRNVDAVLKEDHHLDGKMVTPLLSFFFCPLHETNAFLHFCP